MEVYVLIECDTRYKESIVNSFLTYFARYEHAVKYATRVAENHGYELTTADTDVWEEDERGVQRSYYEAGDHMRFSIDRLSPFDGNYG